MGVQDDKLTHADEELAAFGLTGDELAQLTKRAINGFHGRDLDTVDGQLAELEAWVPDPLPVFKPIEMPVFEAPVAVVTAEPEAHPLLGSYDDDDWENEVTRVEETPFLADDEFEMLADDDILEMIDEDDDEFMDDKTQRVELPPLKADAAAEADVDESSEVSEEDSTKRRSSPSFFKKFFGKD